MAHLKTPTYIGGIPIDPSGASVGDALIFDGTTFAPDDPGGGGSGLFLPLTGGTMTGDIVLPADPTTALEAATKQYVDAGDVALDARVDTLEATDTSLDARLDVLEAVPEWVIGRNTSSTPVVIGTSFTNILAVILTIPAGWATYDVEAYGMSEVLDTSGGSAGTGVVVTSKMVHASGDFTSASSNLELMDLNYHDLHPFSLVAYHTGLTATGSRTFTWQMQRAATFACSADQMTLIVKAYQTS